MYVCIYVYLGSGARVKIVVIIILFFTYEYVLLFIGRTVFIDVLGEEVLCKDYSNYYTILYARMRTPIRRAYCIYRRIKRGGSL